MLGSLFVAQSEALTWYLFILACGKASTCSKDYHGSEALSIVGYNGIAYQGEVDRRFGNFQLLELFQSKKSRTSMGEIDLSLFVHCEDTCLFIVGGVSLSWCTGCSSSSCIGDGSLRLL